MLENRLTAGCALLCLMVSVFVPCQAQEFRGRLVYDYFSTTSFSFDQSSNSLIISDHMELPKGTMTIEIRGDTLISQSTNAEGQPRIGEMQIANEIFQHEGMTFGDSSLVATIAGKGGKDWMSKSYVPQQLIEKTDEFKEILGISCRKYIYEAGDSQCVYWLAEYLKFERQAGFGMAFTKALLPEGLVFERILTYKNRQNRLLLRRLEIFE